MEEQEQILVTMEERGQELDDLAAAYMTRDKKPSAQWVSDCVAMIGVLLEHTKTLGGKADFLRTLAIAMWQAGYEAAPKLEFVLLEGARG